MKIRNYFIMATVAILLQFVLSNPLSIRLIRPDFILIFILYIAVWEGRFWGVIVGFVFGLLVDFSGVGSYFGLSSLTYSIFSYLAGNLHGRFSKWPPFFFHFTWVMFVILNSFIRSIITQQEVLLHNPATYWTNIVGTAVYGIVLILITNLFLPLGKAE